MIQVLTVFRHKYSTAQHGLEVMHLRAALTSTKLGAAISNYCEVLELDKSYDADLKKQVCTGAIVRDRLTGILLRFTITLLRLLVRIYRTV